MTQQKTPEELKKELAGVVAHFQALLDAMEPTPPQPAAPEPVPEPAVPAIPKAPSFLKTTEATRAAVFEKLNTDRATRKVTDDGYARVSALNDQWHELVGYGKDVRVTDEDERPGAVTEHGCPVRKRPSPWQAIERGVRRGETCVLYCKHPDDGWTDALWDAAVAHLKANDVCPTPSMTIHDTKGVARPYWL